MGSGKTQKKLLALEYPLLYFPRSRSYPAHLHPLFYVNKYFKKGLSPKSPFFILAFLIIPAQFAFTHF